MNIQTYPIKYMNPPELREFPIQVDALIIASESLPSLDLEDLMKKHIAMNGQTVEYNYAVMKDGSVHTLRPEIYESNTAVMANSLSVVLEGDFRSESMTAEQAEALENLSLYAMEKFSIPWNGILSTDDIVGTNKMGEFFTTESLKASVASELRTTDSISLGTKSIGAYQTTADEMYGVMYTTPSVSTINSLITVTGNDLASLKAMNPSLALYSEYVPTQIPIMYSKTMTSYVNVENRLPQKIVTAAVKSATSMIGKITTIIAPSTRTYNFKTEISTLKSAVDYNQYGGRPAPSFYRTGLSLPGYDTAALKIYNRSSREAKIIYFHVSPSRFTDSRKPNIQILRSQSGFFVWRNGEQPAELSFSGVMLDSKEVTERHSFLVAYKRYVEDKHTEYMEYFNEFTMKLCIEGIEYSGLVTSVNFSKDAQSPYLYEYNINFLSFSQRNVYMKESADGLTWSVAPEKTKLLTTSGDSFAQTQTSSVTTKDFTYEISSRVTDIFGRIDTSY